MDTGNFRQLIVELCCQYLILLKITATVVMSPMDSLYISSEKASNYGSPHRCSMMKWNLCIAFFNHITKNKLLYISYASLGIFNDFVCPKMYWNPSQCA